MTFANDHGAHRQRQIRKLINGTFTLQYCGAFCNWI